MLSKEQANAIIDAMQADDGDALQTILGNAIQSNQITKDDANALIDAMQADDGEAVETTLTRLVSEQKPLALRPPEDFSPQYTEYENFIRSALPRASTESGDNNLANLGLLAGDFSSLAGRSLAGLTSGVKTAGSALLGGQDLGQAMFLGGKAIDQQMQTRGQTDPNAPWYDPVALAENVIKDPTLPLIPLTGGASVALTRGISSPLLRGVAGGATEGLLSGVAGAGMEQRGLKEELINTALGAGIGGTLGGAFVLPRLRQSGAQMEVEKSLEGIDIPTQIQTPQGTRAVDVQSVESWPSHRRFAHPSLSVDTDLDIPYSKMLEIAKTAEIGVDGGRQASPALDIVFQKIGKKGFDEVNDQMRQIGADIGKIRTDYLPQLPKMDRDAILDQLNNAIEINGYRATIAQNADGKNILRWEDLDGANVNSSDINMNVKRLANSILNSPEEITGNKLEFLRKRADDLIPKDPVTKQPVYSTQEKAIVDFSKGMRDLIDDGVESVSDPATLANFKQLRGDYAQYKEMTDRLGRLIGSDVGETTTKGMSASKRVVESLQDQGSKEAWDFVLEKTGLNLPKNSARALQAMEELGDYRAGNLLSGFSPKETAQKLAQKVGEKKRKFSAVNSEPRAIVGQQVEDFFADYFKKIARAREASSALIPQERNK